ncbi:MAG TPA: hypothetical protein VGE40_10680 [Bacilli bacterium]
MDKDIIRYGGQGFRKPLKTLELGPIKAELMEDGSLRYIKVNGIEMIRSLLVTVRDQNWGTAPGKFSSISVDQKEHYIDISFQAIHQQEDIDFRWRGNIHIRKDGNLIYFMDGEAHADFLKNRIGFCLLHPMDLAGSEVEVETADGRFKSLFSKLITPEDPFVNMKSMAIVTKDRLNMNILFEGELFQTEDQRNWTDGSYKTFCTPLHLPYPIAMTKGTKVKQTVSISMNSVNSMVKDLFQPEQEPILKITGEVLGKLPELGTLLAPMTRPLNDREQDQLKELNLSHVRCSLNLTEADWRLKYGYVHDAAKKLNLDLEIELITDEDERMIQEALELIKEAGSRIKRLSIYPDKAPDSPAETRTELFGASLRACQYVTTRKLLEMLRKHLGQSPLMLVGGGSRSNFTELNRTLMPLTLMDFVEYAVNPQVHAEDLDSIVETLPAQAITLQTAKVLSNELPVHISSVTLKGRMNPYAADDEAVRCSQNRMDQEDQRLNSLFAAGWTLGSFAHLALENAQSINFYEGTGALGMIKEGGHEVCPAYYVIANIGEFANGEVLKLVGLDAKVMTGIALKKGDHLRVIAANLTDEVISVGIDMSEWNYSAAKIRFLDEVNYSTVIIDKSYWLKTYYSCLVTSQSIPVNLPPLSLVFIDF